jgi:hypothetical protein
MKIQIKDEDKPKRRSGLVVAMQRRGRGRHARTHMRDRRQRRAKDARKHWSKVEEWD